jgi:hypothetical protein
MHLSEYICEILGYLNSMGVCQLKRALMQLIYILGISMVLLAFFGCATKQGEMPVEEIPLVFTPTSGEEVIAVPVRPQSIWDKTEPKLREYFSLRIEGPQPSGVSPQVPFSPVS